MNARLWGQNWDCMIGKSSSNNGSVGFDFIVFFFACLQCLSWLALDASYCRRYAVHIFSFLHLSPLPIVFCLF
jgi:hypothetical protein